MKNISSKQIGESTYTTIYNKANDSLNIWIKSELKGSLNLKVNTWKLDSLLCFNRNSDKLIGSVGVQLTKYADTDHDGMYYFYGIKIKDEWFFFFGPYLVLLRENYQSDPHTPLSFARLHQIAMQEIFRGYLKKKDKGFWGNIFQKQEWEINERFFNRLDERDAYNYPFTTQEAWEESWMRLMRENWAHRDTTNYKNTDSL